MRTMLVTAMLTAALRGQEYQGHPSVPLSNDRLEIILLKQGASVASMVLRADPLRTNPLWNPGQRKDGGFGSFLCLDGFGRTSREETAAGLEFHGEALRTVFEPLASLTREGVTSVTLTATLPIVQERLIRNYQVKQGESVLYVRTRLESLLGFDRPIAWAEHATIGSPFLERGVTVVDIPAERSQTRSYSDGRARRLAEGKDFAWPMAPLSKGGTVDLRAAPAAGEGMGHTTTLLQQDRQYSWATAINTKLRLAVGWVWRTTDFPWLQNWENYPTTGTLARGLEFSTQPYDVPRREAVAMSPKFGVPTFRWLPAKSALETSFVIFSSAVPEGFDRVTEVLVENGTIILRGVSGKQVVIAASLPF